MPYDSRCSVDVSQIQLPSLHMTSVSSPCVSLLTCWHLAGLPTVVPKLQCHVPKLNSPRPHSPAAHHTIGQYALNYLEFELALPDFNLILLLVLSFQPPFVSLLPLPLICAPPPLPAMYGSVPANLCQEELLYPMEQRRKQCQPSEPPY